MKNMKNITCIDLTKFNKEKLVEVAKIFKVNVNVLLDNKVNGYAKLFILREGKTGIIIAYTTKEDKEITYTNAFTKVLSRMDSVEIVKEPVQFDVDVILEKISKWGMDSLKSDEKDFLDNLSKD